MASALARSPLPPIRVSEAGGSAAPVVSERSLQQALLALDADNRTLRRKLGEAGTAAQMLFCARRGLTRASRPRGAEALAAALQQEKTAVGTAQAAALARREQAVRASAPRSPSLQTH